MPELALEQTFGERLDDVNTHTMINNLGRVVDAYGQSFGQLYLTTMDVELIQELVLARSSIL